MAHLDPATRPPEVPIEDCINFDDEVMKDLEELGLVKLYMPQRSFIAPPSDQKTVVVLMTHPDEICTKDKLILLVPSDYRTSVIYSDYEDILYKTGKVEQRKEQRTAIAFVKEVLSRGPGGPGLIILNPSGLYWSAEANRCLGLDLWLFLDDGCGFEPPEEVLWDAAQEGQSTPEEHLVSVFRLLARGRIRRDKTDRGKLVKRDAELHFIALAPTAREILSFTLQTELFVPVFDRIVSYTKSIYFVQSEGGPYKQPGCHAEVAKLLRKAIEWAPSSEAIKTWVDSEGEEVEEEQARRGESQEPAPGEKWKPAKMSIGSMTVDIGKALFLIRKEIVDMIMEPRSPVPRPVGSAPRGPW